MVANIGLSRNFLQTPRENWSGGTVMFKGAGTYQQIDVTKPQECRLHNNIH